MIKVFTVHDSKASAYLPPFYMRNSGEAIRAFETTAKDPSTQFNKYPKDFTLFEIGSWDEENGQITMLQHPKLLINAAEFIQ